MATYKKKGFKKDKKLSKDELEYLSQESTTAEVFTSLDEGASKMEKFLEKNQKWLIGGLLAIIIAVIGYMWYDSNVVQPNEISASTDIVKAQDFFDKAINEKDEKLAMENFDKALNGADGKYGFVKIADKYSGTKTGNIANYYIGIIYFKKGELNDAISYLSKYNIKDDIYYPTAQGMIGDAYLETDNNKKALEFYENAFKASDNSFTAPKFYFKAGQVALELGEKSKAKKYFEIIKNKFEKSGEAKNIDIFIQQAE